MKFSEKWLRQWVDPDITGEALVGQLTDAGLEVDGVESLGRDLRGVVVGEVIEVGPHPDAERLRLCRVIAAPGGEALDVVCGAPNVVPGMKAPFATIGARLPGGTKIRKSKIRGVHSNGMLCSMRELGLGDDADGIMSLDPRAPVGADIGKHLDLDDVVIDVDLTPNRGDCLSIAGLAREVGVINRAAVTGPSLEPVPSEIEDVLHVVLEATAACSRYVGRVIRNIDPGARTPIWMVERLRRSGVRAISPVVDVSNYVMLELGHPMHAFDLGKLAKGIRVRQGRSGERLTLLDGEALDIDEASLVIADHERPVALAGIMGGLDSGVTEDTTDLFLECAWFEPRTIAAEARRRGLHTDASHRFERGVATDTQSSAVERATALLLDIVGGRAGPTVDTVDTDALPMPPTVRLRASRIRKLLGIDLEPRVVVDVLTRLGMTVEASGQGEWLVAAPPFRPDIAIESDLIEELARVVGYEAIPEHAPDADLMMAASPEERVGTRAVHDLLVHRGYQEAITYSFVDPKLQAVIDPDQEVLELANPISSEMAVMRTSLWPGLLEAMLYNANRQQTRVRLFETGLVFRPQGERLEQTPMVGAVLTGPVNPVQWGIRMTDADLFDAKADVESLLALAGDAGAFEFEAAGHAALHPGQCARITKRSRPVGWLGAVHPRITADWRLSSSVLAFELRLDAVQEGHLPRFAALSKFPAVHRDIAVVVNESVTAASVRSCVGQAGIDVLKNLELFDVYRGEGIDSGKKSLAIGLTFQTTSRTLNDREVDDGIGTIVDSLAKHLGAELRD